MKNDNQIDDVCQITVGIPTYQRSEQLLNTLDEILSCDPRPNEIIVHIDGNDVVTEKAIKSRFSDIKIIKSLTNIGPGGGRNKIIAAAQNPIVASFDDDSYPVDSDYFNRLQTLFNNLPNVAVIGATIYHIDEKIEVDNFSAEWVADFTGCGCAYRRDVFKLTNGYVCLPIAYGMEEVDLALRLHAMDWGVLSSPWLRVFHNTRLEHHSKPQITAASIANLVLLAYLRYPITHWWFGIGQCLNRIIWLIQHERIAGIFSGILAIPGLIWRNRRQRQVVPAQHLMSYFRLRGDPVPAIGCLIRE